MASTWQTADEIAFVAALGTQTHAEQCRVPRAVLLRQYLQAMSLRQHWGTMRRATIERAAWRMLHEAETQDATLPVR